MNRNTHGEPGFIVGPIPHTPLPFEDVSMNRNVHTNPHTIKAIAEDNGLTAHIDYATDTVYVTMEWPDYETGDVYTEEVPVYTVNEMNDLVGG